MSNDTSKIIAKLDDFLLASFSKVKGQKNVGVLFSAGVDSSVIAKYAKALGFQPYLFTFGTEFSKDFAFAKKLAQDLKLDFYYLKLTKEKISQMIPVVRQLLYTARIDDNLMQISLSIGFFAVAKLARSKNIKLFLSGQGSDELFGGYNKYLTLDGLDLVQQMKNDADNLFKVDVLRDRLMTAQSGVDIYFPYLDKQLIAYAQSLPLEFKINNGERKWILRRLAEYKGLPEYIFKRPKNALQYSSGIQKIVEKIIKENHRQIAS